MTTAVDRRTDSLNGSLPKPRVRQTIDVLHLCSMVVCLQCERIVIVPVCIETIDFRDSTFFKDRLISSARFRNTLLLGKIPVCALC